MEGTTVLFTNLCSGVTVVSNIIRHGDSFEGTVNSKGAGVDSTIQTESRRLGDCPYGSCARRVMAERLGIHPSSFSEPVQHNLLACIYRRLNAEDEKNLQQSLTKLEATDTQILGMSMDSPYANKAFADSVGVTFPLLSDWGWHSCWQIWKGSKI